MKLCIAILLSYIGGALSESVPYYRPRAECPEKQGFAEEGFLVEEYFPCEPLEIELESGDDKICCHYPCDEPQFYSLFGRKTDDGKCEKNEEVRTGKNSDVQFCCKLTPVCPKEKDFAEAGYYPSEYEEGCGDWGTEFEDHCCYPLCPKPKFHPHSGRYFGVKDDCGPGSEIVDHEGLGDTMCCDINYHCPSDQYIESGTAPDEDGSCQGIDSKIGEGCCTPKCPEGKREWPMDPTPDGKCDYGEAVPNPVGKEGDVICCESDRVPTDLD